MQGLYDLIHALSTPGTVIVENALVSPCSILLGGGSMGHRILLATSFGARFSQIYQIKGKTWEVLSPQDAKVGKNPYFGVISEIQTVKFVTYTFGGKIWGSNKNLGSKFWGQAPRPPDMKVPPGLTYLL